MLIYIARRLAWTVLVILVVLFITFLVFFKLPNGDPALRFAGKSPTTRVHRADPTKRLHLDKPFYEEFGYFVWHFVARRRERLARASATPTATTCSVKEQISRAGAANAVADLRRRDDLARRGRRHRRALGRQAQDRSIDRAAMGFALFGISAPVFWLGLMALWIFWRKLALDRRHRLRPTIRRRRIVVLAPDPAVVVLALLYMAIYARMTRNNLLETLGEDYIRTARAKGLSERDVIFKHGLRASLTPIVTLFGLDVALLVGGAIITESVFNLQGLGWLAINGAINQELPTVLGVVLLTATAVAIMNLVVDIVYAFLDPRVRYA